MSEDNYSAYKIKHINSILDNVHGLIALTTVEDMIERLPVFKRLQDIAQLGLADRIFPCALHTRYIHSLGVMYVADKMAIQLDLNDDERQVLRLAGLLHDIGHYPLSHDVEKAYRDFNKVKVPKPVSVSAHSDMEKFTNRKNIFEFQLAGQMNDKFHHESIGTIVIQNCKEIHDIISNVYIKGNEYFHKEINGRYLVLEDITKNVINDICAIIEGNSQYISTFFPDTLSVMVQLMHSELDADNIDYLLRDATFSGTTYGIMDMGLLIGTLRKKAVSFYVPSTTDPTSALQPKIHYIVGVSSKGIGCVEQFLLNKFLAYNQVIHHKYTAILGAMLRNIVTWFLSDRNAGFGYSDIKSIARMRGEDNRFLHFTDTLIINFINEVSCSLPSCPRITIELISVLKRFQALSLSKSGKEESFSGIDFRRLNGLLESTEFYNEIKALHAKSEDFAQKFNKCTDELDSTIVAERDMLGMESFRYQFENHKLTRQVPIDEYDKWLSACKINGAAGGRERDVYYLDRLLNGIAIIDDESDAKRPRLIVDSAQSMLNEIFSLQYIKLRKYDIG